MKYQPKKYTNFERNCFLGKNKRGNEMIHVIAIITKIQILNIKDLINFTFTIFDLYFVFFL